MADSKPGNGYSSPFGNGNGATMTGPSSGAHDFITDPASGAPKTGGRDFAAEPPPEQQSGNSGYNPDSVPQGGTLPFSGEPQPNETANKPFKLNGG